MEMTIPTVCLGSYSANVCPHTFGKEVCFPIEFKIGPSMYKPLQI